MRPEKIVKSQHEIMIGNGTDSILCLTHCINSCFKKAVKQSRITKKALKITNWFCILLQAKVNKKNWMNRYLPFYLVVKPSLCQETRNILHHFTISAMQRSCLIEILSATAIFLHKICNISTWTGNGNSNGFFRTNM